MYMALHSHLLFCFIPHNLFNKHQGCTGTRTTREAALPSLPCLPPPESLNSVPLFLSLKMTARPCRGRTLPGSHLGPVTGLCPHTGWHCRGSWGRFDSQGTDTFTTGTMGTAAHSMGITGALPHREKVAQTLHITPGWSWRCPHSILAVTGEQTLLCPEGRAFSAGFIFTKWHIWPAEGWPSPSCCMAEPQQTCQQCLTLAQNSLPPF